MDATAESVYRLHEQGYNIAAISKRLKISAPKATKILATYGIYTDVGKKYIEMYQGGASEAEIAAAYGVTVKAVNKYIPYTKGQYNAEYPSINAQKIRKSRRKDVDNG